MIVIERPRGNYLGGYIHQIEGRENRSASKVEVHWPTANPRKLNDGFQEVKGGAVNLDAVCPVVVKRTFAAGSQTYRPSRSNRS